MSDWESASAYIYSIRSTGKYIIIRVESVCCVTAVQVFEKENEVRNETKKKNLLCNSIILDS